MWGVLVVSCKGNMNHLIWLHCPPDLFPLSKSSPPGYGVLIQPYSSFLPVDFLVFKLPLKVCHGDLVPQGVFRIEENLVLVVTGCGR